jgi:predicted metal-dependent phosphoesterase TrpH
MLAPDRNETFPGIGIDLHAHTTASDGSLSPTELVEKAAALGLSALAITDHDTIGGLAEASLAADSLGIDLVTGVELSVEDDAGRFHLLGYLFNRDDSLLANTLVTIRASRAERNEQMAVRMAELGLPVTMDDVRAEAGDKGEVIARPHFARALMKAGIVGSVQEAFDLFLATGKPLYLPKDILLATDAIALLHQAGGLAVMAHPGLVPLSDSALAARASQLHADAGLDGIEAYYSQHTPTQTERFLALAGDVGLLVTGGSDFHGTPKPHVSLGIVYDNRPSPALLLDEMRNRLGRQAI